MRGLNGNEHRSARWNRGRPLTNDEKMKYSLAVMKAYVDLTPETAA